MDQKQLHTPPLKRRKKTSTSTDDEPPSSKKSPLPSRDTVLKYKTQMCRNYSEVGYCPYYTKCQFAHGLSELHQLEPAKNQFYRTKLCRPYKEKGICNYGFRCQFSHSPPRKEDDKIGWTVMKQILSSQEKGKSRLLKIIQRNQEF